MSKSLSADDVLPLIACLTPQERRRLIRLISAHKGPDVRNAYRALPPTRHEFSDDEEPLAWDSEGWNNVG